MDCGLWGFAVGGFRIFGGLGCFGCISWEFVFEVLGVGLVFGAADRCCRPLGADFLVVTVTCCMCFGWTGGFSDFRVCLGSLASRGVGVI